MNRNSYYLQIAFFILCSPGFVSPILSVKMAGLSDYDDFRYYYAEEEDKTRQERGDSYSPAINLSSRRIYTSGGVRNVIPSENYVSYNRAYRNVSSPLQNQNYSLGFTDNNGLPSSAYSTPEEEGKNITFTLSFPLFICDLLLLRSSK